MLRSGEAWPKACGVPWSIKFSLNHLLWTLYVNTAFLRCVASGYCDERAGIKIYCTVLSKYWMVWFKSYSILKMSGIGGSFILYNNTQYRWPVEHSWDNAVHKRPGLRAKRSYLHFWRKWGLVSKWSFKHREPFFIPTNTYNTSMVWYHQKMVDLFALCHNLFRAKRSHLANRTMWTNQNQFHNALVSFTSICLVPKGPIWALFAHQECNFK